MSKDTITNDDRLEVLKDVTREILNVTSYLSDNELNDSDDLLKPTEDVDQTINGDEHTENQLDYLTYIHILSVNVEWLGRWVRRNKE